MTQQEIEQIGAAIVITCHELAIERSQNNQVPPEKYARIADFTQYLIFNCYSRANDLFEDGRIVKEQMSEIFWDYLFFFIHLTDRFAITILTDSARHTIIQELGEFAVIVAIKLFSIQQQHQVQDSTVNRHLGILNDAAFEYSKYLKIMPGNNEGRKDTLIWEFSKKLNRIMGSETNPGALVGEEMVILKIGENLDIKSFLKQMKESKKPSRWRFWG